MIFRVETVFFSILVKENTLKKTIITSTKNIKNQLYDKISIYETIDPDWIFPIAYLLDEHERSYVKKPTRHQHLGYDFSPKNHLINDLSLAFYLGKVHLGLCIPSTCTPQTFQRAIGNLIF